MRRILPLLIISLFLACGDGDGGGDGDGMMGPTTPNVAGTWSYSISSLSGGGTTCFASGTTMNLFTQSEMTFTGTYSGGFFICGFVELFVADGTVRNGSVTSDSVVSFDLGLSAWHNSGTISGDSMSGAVTVPVDLGPPVGRVTMSGTFAGIRQ